MKEKQVINQLAHNLTLKMFHTGSDIINYKILTSLPLTAREIEQHMKLTAMPSNKRIQELMLVRMIIKEKRGGKIRLTHLGEKFLETVKQNKENLIKQIMEDSSSYLW